MNATPNVTDFTTFLRTTALIDVAYLPDNSPVIAMAFQIAMGTVYQGLALAGPPFYVLAVYNLGADRVINFAQDQPDRTFFADLRFKLKIDDFVPGVITSSNNVSTGQSMLNPEFMKTLTLADLQNLKTPFGRTYLSIAQQVGVIWGVS